MSLKMKSNLDASGHNVFEGLTQEVEVIDNMSFELLANSILLESYSKIAYNPNNYTEEEQKILDMLSERSFTFVIKSYQSVDINWGITDIRFRGLHPVDNVPFVVDDNNDVVGLEDYISEPTLIGRKSDRLNEDDLALLEEKGYLTDIRVVDGIKYYKRCEVEKLLLAKPNDCEWRDFIRLGGMTIDEDYDFEDSDEYSSDSNDWDDFEDSNGWDDDFEDSDEYSSDSNDWDDFYSSGDEYSEEDWDMLNDDFDDSSIKFNSDDDFFAGAKLDKEDTNKEIHIHLHLHM